MRLKRFVFGFLILSMLACNYVTQMVYPPTATPSPSATATQSATPTLSPTPKLQPAYIPPECGDVPLATIPPDLAVQATPELQVNEISKEEQRNVFQELKNVVEEVYVYPDYNGKDWNEINARYQAKIESGLNTQSFYDEMSAMIEELGDEHSFFLSPPRSGRSPSRAARRGGICGRGHLRSAQL